MDQVKIGKFISECRKKQKLTQSELAEKLNITDRAVSKWENGKSMPDSSIMLELCSLLKITVNELLSGEEINMKEYDKKSEELLIEMTKQKEESDKRLLTIEIVMGVLALLVFGALVLIVALADISESLQMALVLIGIAPIFLMVPFAIRIEQKAGYYECQKCHHKYVPTYNQVLWAMHVQRTRYMTCPECGKKSWQKKVISKD